ncbi:hypothetical protein [Herbiconiux sp. L3-i23]|uniref:hypothetical protein n=1 Tax=Herbiconiux sp. L3-i23 TaxID=2905871 RepID=UPI00205E829C|nr:hypothetical protein [Herbiconiux sp. L3-i23]BDI23036.1 hypothetical protein L3i23_18120 [Herbiconiux sp. L3-i23]
MTTTPAPSPRPRATGFVVGALSILLLAGCVGPGDDARRADPDVTARSVSPIESLFSPTALVPTALLGEEDRLARGSLLQP